jgi:predicted dehydrogenase
MTTDGNATPRRRAHSRREILAAAGAAAWSVTVVPRHVLGGPGQTPPSERVNVAGIGAGGMGGGDIATHAKNGANIVALCDVDDARAAGSFAAFPKAARYKDFRRMFDKEAKRIDAVSVGTPDHIHAVATAAAIRAGKHVYCQKPLTHTLVECRTVTQAARAARVMTQMGNQGHATDGARLTNEWIRAGVIGEIREIHTWSDRAGVLWKQGIPRPTETPPVPPTLDWNLWLGPVRERPYHPIYAPVGWRGWWDFGSGALGDMGAHILDHPVWALGLGPPSAVESRVTLDGTILEGGRNLESYPIAAIIFFEFPSPGGGPPVRLTWYEGGLMPPTPPEMVQDGKGDITNYWFSISPKSVMPPFRPSRRDRGRSPIRSDGLLDTRSLARTGQRRRDRTAGQHSRDIGCMAPSMATGSGGDSGQMARHFETPLRELTWAKRDAALCVASSEGSVLGATSTLN